MTNLSHIRPESYSVRQAAREVVVVYGKQAIDYARGRLDGSLLGSARQGPRDARFWLDVALLIIKIDEIEGV